MSGINFNPYAIDESVLRLIIAAVAAVMTGAFVAKVAMFALRATGLYKIARRRQLRGAWMAWAPVLCNWVMGDVADQYQYVANGRIKNRRLPLLLLSLGHWTLKTAMNIVGIAWATIGVRMLLGEIPFGAVYPAFWVCVLPVLVWVCSVALLVIRSIVVYDLYRSCTEKYSVLYLVLGLVFRFLEPVFFFLCRNKEEGMPPRKEVPVYHGPEIWDEEL